MHHYKLASFDKQQRTFGKKIKNPINPMKRTDKCLVTNFIASKKGTNKREDFLMKFMLAIHKAIRVKIAPVRKFSSKSILFPPRIIAAQ